MIWEHPHSLPAKGPPGMSASEVIRLLKKYPPKLSKYAYGTAGFRYDASVMEAVLVRVAVFCAWWYPQLQKDVTMLDTVGIMVTASHNEENYNGVKLVEPNGEILADPGVQDQLTDWVNNDNPEYSSKTKHPIRLWLEQQVQAQSTSLAVPSCIIHIGYDTRSHSPALSELAVKVIQALGGQVLNHGVATTPLLHHVVLHQNSHRVPSIIPLRQDAVGYYHLLSWSYYNLLCTASGQHAKSEKRLVVDCACGVGYPSLEMFQKTLQSLVPSSSWSPKTTFCTINGPTHGPLNENCGSEYVQKSNASPRWYRSDDPNDNIEESWEYCAALDGDADRIVFFHSNGSDFFLLDGDKITVLICEFLQAEVAALRKVTASADLDQLRLGAVQTAYANGASTEYLRKVLGAENVLIAKTGVQHVHHAAKTFDIGVYFEANGHGTVVFGPNFYSYLAKAEALFMSTEESRPVALQRLRLLPSLINQAVGDALSDLLVVDAILHLKGWNLKQWNQLYADLPSRMTKLKVADRKCMISDYTVAVLDT